MNQGIRVSLVEDDPGIRENLQLLLESSEGFEFLQAYSSGEEALQLIPGKLPDVVIVDINLPGISGIEVTRKLKATFPALQILILTMYEDSDQVFDALRAGAAGYLLKRTNSEKILEGLREIKSGCSPMSGSIARMVVQHFQQALRPPPGQTALSPREKQILQGLSEGYRYKEIAAQLGITYDTVRAHIRNIYEKLHVTSRTEAVVKFLART
jgi:DNA-binding NarL/FixJ family response regulator